MEILKLLKLGSIAYIEALEKYGEPEAVAVSKDSFEKYNKILSSMELNLASRSPKSGFYSNLSQKKLDMFLEDVPCARKYCKGSEVTDDDIRLFFNRSDQKSVFDYKNSIVSNNFSQSLSLNENDEINPQKIIAHHSTKREKSPDIIDKINRGFQRNTQVESTEEEPAIQKKFKPSNSFTTARRELQLQSIKKYGTSDQIQMPQTKNTVISTPAKLLGGKLVNKPFKMPRVDPEPIQSDSERDHPLLKSIDPKILETIKLEIIDSTKDISWNDIAGLGLAKETIREAVVLPLLRPDLFTGLRSVAKAILLFGPPGTGKTLIGKCISAQSRATFFSISASSLTSKWIGEGEKLVKALFLYARYKQPSVIFLDEIDSVLTKRSDSEHESSRRLKTEFLIQLEGAHTTNENDRVLLVGATNRPQELDDAARRRFTKRLYIPLPDLEARQQLLVNLLKKNTNFLSQQDVLEIAIATDGYSGADIKNLCADAAMICLRELSAMEIENMDAIKLRPMKIEDFRKSLRRVKATVSQSDLQQYIDWDLQYGSTA